MTSRKVSIEINGETYERDIEPRLLLSDFIRHEAGLTGTHVGCEHGVCGACTVQIDGQPVRSCLTLAVQAEGRSLTTVESLADEDGTLHPLQQAFHETHGLQCGFCTPGFLMSLEPLLGEARDFDDREIREALAGNLCRCTGYQNIVAAVQLAATNSDDRVMQPVDLTHPFSIHTPGWVDYPSPKLSLLPALRDQRHRLPAAGDAAARGHALRRRDAHHLRRRRRAARSRSIGSAVRA